TTTSNDLELAYFVTATCANWAPASGFTERTDTTFCTQSAATNVDLAVDEGQLGAAGAVPAATTTDDSAAVGITMAVALRRDAAAKTCNTTVQLSKPIPYRSSAFDFATSADPVTLHNTAG